MNARYFTFADGADRNFICCTFGRTGNTSVRCLQSSLHPMIFTVDIFQNFFGKRDGRTAWCIQFMNMVCLAHRHVVGRKLVHNLCQILIHGREDGHAQAEIGCPEQRFTSLGTKFLDFLTVFVHPSGTAGNQLHSGFEGFYIIGVGYHRICEFYGNVCALESVRVKILLVVYVDDADNLVSATEGNLFDFLTHFTVTD